MMAPRRKTIIGDKSTLEKDNTMVKNTKRLTKKKGQQKWGEMAPPIETDKIDPLDTEESLDVFLSVSKG